MSTESTVPRGTRHNQRPIERGERLSVRVPPSVKTDLHKRLADLKRHGVTTTATELVEMLVVEGLRATPAQLDARLRAWRKSA
jgi:hypothetical protein